MSIADGQHDLQIIFCDSLDESTTTWSVSCSELPDREVASFLGRVASGTTHYERVVENDDWSV